MGDSAPVPKTAASVVIKPVHVGGVEGDPVGSRLHRWRQTHVYPHGAQGEQEDSIHDAFQVCGESHPDVREAVLHEASDSPNRKRNMPCHIRRRLLRSMRLLHWLKARG